MPNDFKEEFSAKIDKMVNDFDRQMEIASNALDKVIDSEELWSHQYSITDHLPTTDYLISKIDKIAAIDEPALRFLTITRTEANLLDLPLVEKINYRGVDLTIISTNEFNAMQNAGYN